MVQVSNNEFDWKNTNSSVAITVVPPYWQTGWFRWLLVILLLTAVYLLFRRREKSIQSKAAIRQQMAELEGKIAPRAPRRGGGGGGGRDRDRDRGGRGGRGGRF